MCRATCWRPLFASLPEAPGWPATHRMVHGMPIDGEEYVECGWHVRSSYHREDGSEGLYWVAELPGLRAYHRRAWERLRAVPDRLTGDVAFEG